MEKNQKVFCKYYSCGRRIGVQFDEKENLFIGGKYSQPKTINPQKSDKYKKDFKKYMNDRRFVKIIESNFMMNDDLKYLKEKGFTRDVKYENLLKSITEAKRMTEENVIK